MSNLVILFIHFIAALARLLGPGGVRSIVAESLLLKHQLLIVNTFRLRSVSSVRRPSGRQRYQLMLAASRGTRKSGS